jgi:DNA-binding protein H-NS
MNLDKNEHVDKDLKDKDLSPLKVIVSHKLRLSKEVSKLTRDETEKIIMTCTNHLEYIKKEEALFEEKRQRRAETLTEVKALLATSGLELKGGQIQEMITPNIIKVKRMRSEEEDFRYIVLDKVKRYRFWSGCGHMPAPFKQAVESGYTKKDLISDNMVQLSEEFEKITDKEKDYGTLGFKYKRKYECLKKKNKREARNR